MFSFIMYYMDAAVKRILAMVFIMVTLTVGLWVVVNDRYTEEPIYSMIDDIEIVVDDVGEDSLNATIRFGMSIENYGSVRNKIIECSSIQNYLVVKNATENIQVYQGGEFDKDTSYIMNDTYTKQDCQEMATEFRVSENVIDNIIVAVPFRFIDGTYSFTWYHSFADLFKAAVITVDISNVDDPISYILESPYEG